MIERSREIGTIRRLLELNPVVGIFGAIGISYLVTGAAAWWVIERVLDKHGA